MKKFLLITGLADSLLNFRGPLMVAIQSCNLEVHVAAPDLPLGSPLRQRLESLGLQVHDIPLRRNGTNPLADLVLLWHLWFLIRRIKPHSILGYTVKPVIYGTLAAWLAGVPRRFALVTGLGYAFTQGRKGFLSQLIRRLYAFALNRAQKVFFQNPDDQTLFHELGILSSHIPSIVVNGSGVDVTAYTVKPLLSGTPRFLLIARLLGDKGVREYAEAAALVQAHYPQARFDLVGWIDSNPDAISQEELDGWVAQGHVRFLGKMVDVRPAIADCSVYVLPSYREGTPRTVLEAMAMGRAVITTDAPGCRETVVDGDNGFLIPVKSVSALVQAMFKFIEEPALAYRMGLRGRQIAEEKYDVHKVNAVMLKEMGIQ